MRLPIVQIDAFADRPFTGNPAAVMPLDAWLDDDVLQAIAQENNLSETAFLLKDTTGAADYELRWFTPAAEVVLCGHATLASGHYLLESDPSLDRVTFRTRKAGLLSVARAGAGYADGCAAAPATGQFIQPDFFTMVRQSGQSQYRDAS
ncbi:MAG: PhzF family phenazine biosynthesis isomerase, partial [Sphingomonas sp.]|nr:PhzF family phenazine biosynthesis isomerase [Sphingomonas sp.]